MLNEISGQPVKKLRVAGALSLGAEVSESFDQTSAKKLFPKAINDHTGDKRVAGVGKPVGQPQAVAGLVGGQAGKDRGDVRFNLLAFAPTNPSFRRSCLSCPGFRGRLHLHLNARFFGLAISVCPWHLTAL